jgi:hypothetical protein
VGIVTSFNVYFRPYAKHIYSTLDMVVSLFQITVLLLGILIHTQRTQSALQSVPQTGMLTNQGWAYFVLALLLVTFLFALYCILYDCGLMSFSMRVAHVREKARAVKTPKSCLVSKRIVDALVRTQSSQASVLLHDDIFHLDASEPALVQWCEGASLDELALLRDVEKMLRNVKAQHHDFGSAANRRNQGTNQDTRLALFCAQIEHTTPLLLNWCVRNCARSCTAALVSHPSVAA